MLLDRLVRLSGGLMIAGLLGCSSSKPVYTATPGRPRTESPKETTSPPEPSAFHTYTYRVVTDNCNCEVYKIVDSKNTLEYRFRARYTMDAGIHTNIEIEVDNNSNDTLFFDHGTAKVSSRNVAYQFNDRFIPLPDLTIPPKKSDVVKLAGKERTDENDWHKIAGEQMTITIRGLLLGAAEVKSQSATFVPENPMIGK